MWRVDSYKLKHVESASVVSVPLYTALGGVWGIADAGALFYSALPTVGFVDVTVAIITKLLLATKAGHN